MNTDDAVDIERKGAAAGLNPIFGEWRHRFPFAPAPYGNGKALAACKASVHADLANVHFFYSNTVQLEITLFLDLQTVLDTSDTADLDNYAKAILDCLRGPAGIMFDDTQVQTLCVSWIDSHETYFEVVAKASPDDFVLKGVEFYEMPNGLWYPHGKAMWTKGGAEETSHLSLFAGLLINQMMSGVQRHARIAFRNSGYDRLRAYRTSNYFANSARGYHKSRVADAGFALHPVAKWTADLEQWKKSDSVHAAELEAAMKGMREAFEAVVKAATS